MGRHLNNFIRRALPPPFARATRILKTELFQRPLWYDVVKYAPPIVFNADEKIPRRARPLIPKHEEERLYQHLLRVRPMLRMEPLNALSNTPSLGYRFVTTQMMLMKNDRLSERTAFDTTMRVLTPELEAFEDRIQFTGKSKFRGVSKEKILHNLNTMFHSATVAPTENSTAAAGPSFGGDFSNILKSAAATAATGTGGASIYDAAPKPTAAAAPARSARVSPLQSEPVQITPLRAIARPAFYDEDGNHIRSPTNVVEAEWAVGTPIEKVIESDADRRVRERQERLQRQIAVLALRRGRDLTPAEQAELQSQAPAEPEAEFPESVAIAEAAIAAEPNRAKRREMRRAMLEATAAADDAGKLLADDTDAKSSLVEEEFDDRTVAAARRSARAGANDADADADADAEDDSALDAELASAQQKEAKSAAELASRSAEIAPGVVDDFNFDHTTTRWELENYLNDKANGALPDGTNEQKAIFRMDILHNLKLKRAMLAFEVLRQAMLSNDERKIDVAIRSTYDDLFGFANPLAEREVLKSVIYDLTRMTDGSRNKYADPAMGKQRIDLRTLLTQARHVRESQAAAAAAAAAGTATSAGATAAASSAGAAPAGVSTAEYTLTGFLDDMFKAGATGQAAKTAAAGASGATEEGKSVASIRAAKINAIKAELSGLRKFADQRWELAHYLHGQLKRQDDEAKGNRPRNEYPEDTRPALTLPRMRGLMLTEMDIAQRVLGVDTAPTFGTAEADRQRAFGVSNPFKDSAAGAKFAPLAAATSHNAGSFVRNGHVLGHNVVPGTAGRMTVYPYWSGSSSARDAAGKRAMPSFLSTGRYEEPRIGHKKWTSLTRLVLGLRQTRREKKWMLGTSDETASTGVGIRVGDVLAEDSRPLPPGSRDAFKPAKPARRPRAPKPAAQAAAAAVASA